MQHRIHNIVLSVHKNSHLGRDFVEEKLNKPKIEIRFADD